MKAPAEQSEPESRRPSALDRGTQPRLTQPTQPTQSTQPAQAARLPAARLSAVSARRLQRSVGNRAASKVLGRPAVQRLESAPEAAPRPPAEADPRFASVEAEVRGKQKQVAAHPPATAEAAASQAAAVAPPDDKLAQGKAANAEKMNAAKPGEFDKAAFVRAVEQAIAAQAPKNLDDADKFGESGKADAVKGQVQGQVGQGKAASAGPIETATNAPPDTAAAVDKPVTPLAPDRPPGAPAPPDAAKAVPEKAPASATDFSAGPKQVDGEMAAAQVTEDQLAKSNEPEFTGALADKKENEQHAATAPGKIRGAEAETLGAAKAGAAQQGAAAMAGLAGARQAAGGQVTAEKQGTKSKDEARRAQVTATLQKVFDATKTDVEAILSGLDKKVDDAFTAGEKAARDAFTAEHKQKMDAFKDKRYSGFTGKLKWVKDKFAGLPEEANQIFVSARQGYVTRMRGVISSVADTIGGELNRAKARIATGREQLQAEVRKLPADLQALGKQAAGDLAGKFDELTESVDAKGTELVQTLATKYNEALKSVDAEIDAEKEKNKGLVAKAVGAIKGVIDTILKLKDLLLGMLAKAAAAVMGILRDPIGFLGNLVSAVGAGLRAFLGNIGEHLKKGLVRWLLGAMAGAGLQLPAKFDLRGVIMMIGSLLGLTWAAIRGRILSRGVPEPAMAAAEGAVPVAQKLKAEGVGGIWETIKEKAGDLKAGLFGKIATYLIPTILIAGVTTLVSMLNPASAFIRAVKMIIDIVTFIVTQGAQIIEFVNAVLDAIVAIAGGGAGGVPALIENALALSIPVLIGALAAILNISGIADKVKKIIQSLSKPVMKVVDWVVDKIAGVAKKLWAKLKGAGKKVKDRFSRPAGAAGTQAPDGQRRAIAEANQMLSRRPSHADATSRLPAIANRHHVPLRLVVETRAPDSERVHVQTMSTESHDLPARDERLVNLDGLIGKARVDGLCATLGEPEVLKLIDAIKIYGVQKVVTGLSDSAVASLLGQLDAALLPKIFTGRQTSTGPAFADLIAQFGAADVNLLAAALGGKLALITAWDMFHFDARHQGDLDAGKGAVARSLPALLGKTVAEVRAILLARGMALVGTRPDHEMYSHPDHSVVRIKTGPAAHGPFTPFNHVVLEVTKTAGDVSTDAVFAKVVEGGQAVPQGTKDSKEKLRQWFKARCGRFPDLPELAAMMGMWGKVGHIRLQ
ncbi:phage tail protein [Actinokineospora diospyrosa]|uniref:Phage-related protein n=1 Tax=Actinokineospora diospyrosa TaxID=103728 RepID=A0ABT1IFV7_9PSEU|nr:hypothetical protein [Actinokineospora diospyrosa]MCP2271500.1 hypothetical protein [Actinokineospora diospyrosa]